MLAEGHVRRKRISKALPDLHKERSLYDIFVAQTVIRSKRNSFLKPCAQTDAVGAKYLTNQFVINKAKLTPEYITSEDFNALDIMESMREKGIGSWVFEILKTIEKPFEEMLAKLEETNKVIYIFLFIYPF